MLRVSGGRFLSQLDMPCDSVNTWPVLASPADDVMLGTAIVLPDHPQIAPESRGNLFDNTEIEEALVLHVQVLSDEERAEIERQDPAVREMIERASAVTSDQLAQLHGRMTEIRDPTQGLAEVEVDGVLFRRGGRVVIRPGLEADLQARMLEGQAVTVERIQRDYDGRVHLGVSVEAPGPGDPARHGALPVVLSPRGGGGRVKRILVAGIGNMWLGDDGFGGEVVKRLEARELPKAPSCSTSAPAGSTSPTRSCAATTRSCSSTSRARAASPGRST